MACSHGQTMWSETARHVVVCALCVSPSFVRKWGKRNVKMMVQENRTARWKVNGTETSGAGVFHDGGGWGANRKQLP